MSKNTTYDPHAEQSRKYAEATLRSLVDAGYLAYFAGGCVRDMLRGETPEDYDIATNATPDQVCQVFSRQRTKFVGASFGVVIVHDHAKPSLHQVEVATFRSDGSYSDGRRPDSVEFTSPEQDALRRDFTINAIFYDPIQKQYIDYVGGQNDLIRGIVRAVGDPHHRFQEDKLRMLRAVRFAVRFGYSIDPETERAIAAMAPTLNVVSPERISMELHKTLSLPNNGWALSKLYATRLLATIHPDLFAFWRDDAIRQSSLDLVQRLPSSQYGAVVAAMFWDWLLQSQCDPSELASDLKERWRISNAEAASIANILTHSTSLQVKLPLPWSRLQPILVSSDASEAIALAQAIRSRRSEPTDDLEAYRQYLSWQKDQLNPDPLLSGSDLLHIGIAPGPAIAKLLSQVRDLQLDGQLRSREDAMAWIQAQRESGSSKRSSSS